MNRIYYNPKGRTRIQWFSSLPFEIKHKAIANYERTGRSNYDHPFKTLRDCLTGSFMFSATPEDEGAAFWNDVIEQCEPIVP